MTEADVVVVGAGLAGLAAATRLVAAGRSVQVLEAADAPGGRMRSEVVDGFIVDRGFQVLNTAYSELQRLDVLQHLDLRRLDRGAYLRSGDALHLLADPRRIPAGVVGLLTGPLGTLAERARLGAFLLGVAYFPVGLLRRRADVPFRDALQRHRIDGAPTEHFLRPFLAGVLQEDALTTSSRFAEYVLRTFVRGDVVVPAAGMGALPALLAERLPTDTVQTGRVVTAVRPGQVDVAGAGTVHAGAVIVAADPVRASSLLGLPQPTMHAITTTWHATPTPPTDRPMIALDTEGGPVANSVVLSNAAPSYGSGGRALIASSTLGPEPLPDDVLRSTLARLWGVDTASWRQVAQSRVPQAVPALPGGTRRSVQVRVTPRLAPGLYVAGDWRESPSSQGALRSGRRAAEALLADR
ncbi:NAD(P)/FAD-dependent oxidoreductase [uncultured Amnibacterium sp.]|uniref:NAD(P)/FAD-dependent oxidoreductase n=1 Tax=uncultured Amnibacterium sp. TaxID=1631851 RepID=UPI0035CB8340